LNVSVIIIKPPHVLKSSNKITVSNVWYFSQVQLMMRTVRLWMM